MHNALDIREHIVWTIHNLLSIPYYIICNISYSLHNVQFTIEHKLWHIHDSAITIHTILWNKDHKQYKMHYVLYIVQHITIMKLYNIHYFAIRQYSLHYTLYILKHPLYAITTPIAKSKKHYSLLILYYALCTKPDVHDIIQHSFKHLNLLSKSTSFWDRYLLLIFTTMDSGGSTIDNLLQWHLLRQ